jgi:hypothetical protein
MGWTAVAPTDWCRRWRIILLVKLVAVITGSPQGPIGDRNDNREGYRDESRELQHLSVRKALASWWR